VLTPNIRVGTGSHWYHDTDLWLRSKLVQIAIAVIELTSDFSVFCSPISFRIAFDAQITARQQWLRSKLVRIAIAVIDLISDFSVFRSPISVCIAFDAQITARQQWLRSKLARIAIALIELVGLFVIGRVCALLFDHVGC
jgi:hypothetical protein